MSLRTVERDISEVKWVQMPGFHKARAWEGEELGNSIVITDQKFDLEGTVRKTNQKGAWAWDRMEITENLPFRYLRVTRKSIETEIPSKEKERPSP